MDEENIDIEGHDVNLEQQSDDEHSAHEFEHQLDARCQPGSTSNEPSHHDTQDTFNIQIKQELSEYEYLSDCNDIDEADNFDQADNIDRSDNNIDQTDSISVPENAKSEFNDNIDGSVSFVEQANKINIDHNQDFNTADHSDNYIDGSDNLDQVSDFEQVNGDIISSHASDIEIISSNTEYQLPNKIIIGSKVILGSKIPTQKTEVGFATPNALDPNKTSVHSFPVPVSRNKARKSTSKGLLNYIRKPEVFKREVAKKSTGGSKLSGSFCKHCHMIFSDQASLLKHLYESLLIEEFNCSNCNLKFTTQNELTMHSIEHKELPNPKLVKVTKDLSVNDPKIDNTKLSKDLTVNYPKIDKTKLSKDLSVNDPKIDNTKLSKDLTVNYPKIDNTKLSKDMSVNYPKIDITKLSKDLSVNYPKIDNTKLSKDLTVNYPKIDKTKLCKDLSVNDPKIDNTKLSKDLTVNYPKIDKTKLSKDLSVNYPKIDNTKLSKDLTVNYPKIDNTKLSKDLSVNYPKTDNTKLSKDLSVNDPKVDNTKLSKANWLAVNKNDDRFKCTLCSEIFDNYNNCKKHRDSIHPGTKNHTIFTKLTAKKRKDEVIDVKNEDSVMIPKSTLFKCRNCKLHFLSGFTSVLHKTCNIVKNFWLCGICNRKFSKEDENLHKKQHEVNTRFRVYLIVSDLYHRILCRCPHCSLHFEEKQFKPHLKYCRKIPKEICSTCKILLPKSRFAEHTRKHTYFHFQPADFFILNYITEKHKRKSDTDLNETAVKIRKLNEEEFSNKVVIYYCKNCKCCVSTRKPLIRELHATKRCFKNSGKICEECGLLFTNKAIRSHSQYHSGRNISIRDIKMVDIVTMKVIALVIPNYPQCGKCKINFFSMKTKDDHLCGENYETCEFCGDRYHNSVCDVHRLFHDGYTPAGTSHVNPKTNNADAFKITNSDTTKINAYFYTEVDITPDMIKEWESLKFNWHCLLFNCTICDINTDSYDKCVEHSQCHIAQRFMQEQSIKCYICNLKFDETLWSKHAEYHAHTKTNINNFKVLRYDPRNLLTETWFQMFESLLENDINQLLNESMYGTERSVKMKLLKPGRPEFTLYTCANCRIYVEQDAISRHVADKCRVSANVCQVCDIAFEDVLNLQQHEDLHKKGIDKYEFRIVSFKKLIEQSVVNKMGQNGDKYKPYTVYKCANCDVCVTLRHSIMRHYCGKNIQKFCKICNQKFAYQSIPKHNRIHKTDPNFKAMNINIRIFQPQRQTPYPRKHTKFPHKIPIKVNKFNMQRPSKLIDHKVPVCQDLKGRIMLYKCSECQVCFVLHPSAENHRCDNVRSKFYCQICRETFGSNTIPKHEVRHALNPTFKADNFIINYFKPRTKTTAAAFTIKRQDIKVKETKKVMIKKPLDEIKDKDVDSSNGEEIDSQNEEEKVLKDNFKKYKVFKCVECHMSRGIKSYKNNHRCTYDARRKYRCKTCDLIILKCYKTKHLARHNLDPNFRKENLEIIPFRSNQSLSEKLSFEESDENDDDDVADGSMDVEQNKYKYIQYECTICKVNLSRKDVHKDHNCRSILHKNFYKTFFCDICKLSYSLKMKSSHILRHTTRPDYNSDTIQVVPFCNDDELDGDELYDDELDGESNDESDDESNDESDDESDDDLASSIDINDQETEHLPVNYEQVDLQASIVSQENDLQASIDGQEIENIGEKKHKYVQYECTICKVNLSRIDVIKDHNCTSMTHKNFYKTFFCDICKLSYSLKIQSSHRFRHKTRPDYKRDTIKIVPFCNDKTKDDTIKVMPIDPQANTKQTTSNFKDNATFKTKKNKKIVSWYDEITKRKYAKTDGAPVSTIYKCDCGLHFTSKTTVDSHIEICNNDLEVSKENCSKCGLLFPTDILVNHLCKHHSKDIEIKIVTVTKSHEDEEDDVAEIDDHHAIDDEQHIISDDDQNDLPNDLEVNENNLSTDVAKNEPQPSTSRTKPDLFKCSECNVYYVKANTCLKHVKYHEKLDPKQYIECKLCGLQFTFMTLRTHMKIHHETPFDVDKIVVEIYHPVEEGLPLKKELFCASERLQSLLVTSSNDEGCSSSTY